MKRTFQTGSAHAVIIVLLVLALLGALGFVFYQNFIQKPVDTIPTQTEESGKSVELTTQRIAFGSKIYAVDYPAGWTVATETKSDGSSAATLQNDDKTLRAKIDINSMEVSNSCDATSTRKVRFYNVSNKAITKLNGSNAYMVEAMTDAIGGGYDYYIGLTQDGGDTHAAVGDSYCTVTNVGAASRLVLSGGAVVHPTILATIDFPKLAAGTDKRVKEMQQVKDVFARDDYTEAVKILESVRRE